jgi:thymidylate synthase
MLQMHSVEGDFTVGNGKLNTCFVMRSNDVPFGLPFNIMSYALINHIFAKHLGLQPGELVYMGWDVHIYQNQMKMVKEQLTRTPKSLPKINIKVDLPTLGDILNLQWEDIELIGYDPHPDIADKPEMAT